MSLLMKILKKPLFIIVTAALFTVGICSAVVVLFVLPQYSEMTQIQEKNKTTQTKIDLLTSNIKMIKSFAPDEIDRYTNIIESFYPEEASYLHFVTLNEELANSVGVGVTSLSISATKATGSTGKSPAVGPAAGANGGVAKSSPANKTTTSASGFYVQIAYKGDYKNVEYLLSKLENLDRAVGVNKLTLTQLESGADVSASVVFYLPTAKKGLNTASSESVIALSEKDRKFIDDLEARIEFSANPAKNKLGKDNPFQ